MIEEDKSAQSRPGCAASLATSDAEPSAQFTPGPWSRSGVREKWRTSYSDHLMDSHTVGPDDAKGWVALVPYSPHNHAEDLANARLIAAAPDLYEALKACADWINRHVPIGTLGATTMLQTAREALARATPAGER